MRSLRTGLQSLVAMTRTRTRPILTMTLRIRCMGTPFRPFASCCEILRAHSLARGAALVPSQPECGPLEIGAEFFEGSWIAGSRLQDDPPSHRGFEAQ